MSGTPEELYGEFQRAFDNGNVDAILALYEPECVLTLPHAGEMRGLDGVREALDQFLATKAPISFSDGRVTICGDLALASYGWAVDGNGPDGGSMKMTGRTSDVLRRQTDGSWRFVIDSPFGGGAL